MPSWIGPWEIIIVVGGVVASVFYFMTQARVLQMCSPYSRRMSPGLVWLQFIPVFNLAWQFVVVHAVGASAGTEFRSRGIAESPAPTRGNGIAVGVLQICYLIIFIGGAILFIPSLLLYTLAGFGLAYLATWITYWARVAALARRLSLAPPAGNWQPPMSPQYRGQYPPQAPPPNWPNRFCGNCGNPVGGHNFCPSCGARQ